MWNYLSGLTEIRRNDTIKMKVSDTLFITNNIVESYNALLN